MKRNIFLFFLLFFCFYLKADKQAIEFSYGYPDFSWEFKLNPLKYFQFYKIERAEAFFISLKITLGKIWIDNLNYYINTKVIKYQGVESFKTNSNMFNAIRNTDIQILYFSPFGLEYNFLNFLFLSFFSEIDIGVLYWKQNLSGYIWSVAVQWQPIGEIVNIDYFPFMMRGTIIIGAKMNLNKNIKLTLKAGTFIPVLIYSIGIEFVGK